MENRIVIEQLSKSISKTKIIKGIDLAIRPGEVYGLLGPNGAGKTTTIRMIVGLMKPTSGRVLINGYDLNRDFEKAISRVGAVVENPEMYDYLSGYDNLLHYQRMMPGVKKSRIHEVAELVGMTARLKEKTGTYSLGMRQRLGLAQALLHEPDVLILDEPTNGLDPAGIREIRSYLRSLAHEEGISIIVSSHLLSEMEKMCDRIAVIKQGEIIAVSDVKSFIQQKEDRIILRAKPIQDARKVIRAYLNSEAEQDGEELDLNCSEEQIPGLIKELITAGVQVYEVRHAAPVTLEEQFLQVTGGESL